MVTLSLHQKSFFLSSYVMLQTQSHVLVWVTLFSFVKQNCFGNDCVLSGRQQLVWHQQDKKT